MVASTDFGTSYIAREAQETLPTKKGVQLCVTQRGKNLTLPIIVKHHWRFTHILGGAKS